MAEHDYSDFPLAALAERFMRLDSCGRACVHGYMGQAVVACEAALDIAEQHAVEDKRRANRLQLVPRPKRT